MNFSMDAVVLRVESVASSVVVAVVSSVCYAVFLRVETVVSSIVVSSIVVAVAVSLTWGNCNTYSNQNHC